MARKQPSHDELRQTLTALSNEADGSVPHTLYALNQQFQAVLARLPLIVFVLDPTGIILTVLGKSVQTLQLDPDAIVGESVFSLFPKRPDIEHDLYRALAGEEFVSIRTILDVVLETHFSPIRTADGTLAGTMGVAVEITEHASLQAALRESEERYRIVSELVTDYAVAYHIEPDGTFVPDWITDAAPAVIGYSDVALLVPGTRAQVVHPEDQHALSGVEQQLVLNQKVTREFRIVMPGGEIRWLRATWQPYWDEAEGRVTRVYSIGENITAQKQADSTLRASEAYYRSLFTKHPAVMLLVDPDSGAVVDANETALRFYGYTLEEITARNINEINTLPPDEVHAEMERARRGERDYFEFRHRLASGEIREVEVRSGPVTLQGRTLLYSVIHDATPQRRAEAALQQSRAHQQAILAALPDLIIRLRRDGTYLYVHSGISDNLLVAPESTLVGRTIHELLPADVARAVDDAMQRVLASGEVQHVDYQLDVPAGRRYFEARMVPSGADEVLLIARDITEQRQAEESLRRSEEQHRMLFETMTQGVIYQDANGAILAANPAAERVLGLTVDQMQGRTSLDPRWRPIHEDGSDFPGETHPPMVALRTGQPVTGVIIGVFNPAEDDHRWLSVDALPQFHPGEDTPYQVYTTFTDITGQRNAAEALRRSEQQHRILFETMTQGVVYQDANGAILAANPAAERILGLTLDQMQGRTSLDPRWRSIHEDGSDFAGETHPAMVALRTGRPVHGILMGVFNPADDAYRWLAVDAIPLFHAGEEKPYQVYTTFTDITGQRNAAEALRRSEARYASLFANNHAIMMLIDPATAEIVEVNQAACDFYGYDHDTFVAKTVTDLSTLSREDMHTAIDQARTGGKRYFTLNHRLASGEIRTIEMYTGPLEVEGRALLYSVVHDITERHQARAALEESEEKLRSLIEQSQDGIALTDEQGIVIGWNPAQERITGIEPDQALGRPVWDVLVDASDPKYLRPNSREFIKGLILAAVQTGQGEWLRRPLDQSIEISAGVFRHVQSLSFVIPIKDRYMLGTITRDVTERHQARAALEESEARQRAILTAIPDLMFRFNRDGTYLDLFAEGEKQQLLAKMPQPAIGRDLAELLPDDVAALIKRHIILALDTNDIQRIEYRLDTASGLRDFEARLVPSGADEVMSIVRDITERKRSEQAEREQRDFAEALADTAVILNSVLDLDTVLDRILQNLDRVVPHDAANVMLVTDGVARVVRARGFEQRGLAEAVLEVSFVIDDTPHMRHAVGHHQSQFIPDTETDPHWKRIPVSAWIRSHATAPIMLGGQVIGMLNVDSATPHSFTEESARRLQAFANQAAIAVNNARLYEQAQREIAERMRVETALRESEAFLQSIYAGTQQGIFVIDVEEDGSLRVASANQALQRMAGLGNANLSGKQVGELVPLFGPSTIAPLQAHVRQCVESHSTAEYEFEYSADGQSYWLLVRLEPLFDATGRVHRVIGTAIPITERKRLEAQRLELALEREKVNILTEFVTDISHEVRTPLSVTLMSLDGLERSLPLDDRARRRITNIRSQATYIGHLIDSMLTMAQLDSKAYLLFGTLAPNDLVHSVFLDVQPEVVTKSQTLVLDLASDVPRIRGHEQELHRALHHVVENAILYTPDEGAITIRSRADDDSVIIEVQDSGIGIEPDDLPHIFERFYRADKARTERRAGLGLAIAKKVLDVHQGRIEVESAPGSGSLFRLILPVQRSTGDA